MNSKPTIFVVKGVSGSGKSTRTFLLLSFLEYIGLEIEDHKFVNFENKEKSIGVLVKDLGLIFIGKKYYTESFQRFQGYDAITGYFGKSSYLSDYLKSISGQYSIVIEGAGVTGTNRLRPLFLHDFCDYKNIFIQYYNYNLDQKEEYNERLLYRSGKVPVRGTMWDKCSGFISDHRDSVKEIKILKDKGVEANCETFYDLYDVEVYDFGVKFLVFMGMEDFIGDFVKFCEESNYIQQNSFNYHSNGK